jgi:NSS family neurotransmitter:Na+ symporter
VGLGNIWRFPTVVAQNGGGAFVAVYLVVVLFIGLPAMMSEMVMGRAAQRNVVGAFKVLKPRSAWFLVGAIGGLAAFIILSYYSVIAGWGLYFLYLTLSGDLQGLAAPQLAQVFATFTGNPLGPVLLHFIFMALTALVVKTGVGKGIERYSKIMMPSIFVILLILLVRSLSLEGAMEGVYWFLRPDLSGLSLQGVLIATGQAFFSFSLGMGALVTYGSYLTGRENIPESAAYVAFADVAVALLAGLVVIPAVFAFGFPLEAGPGLVFVTIPAILNSLPLGSLFGTAFFLLLLFAALTSSVSLMEVITAIFIDERRWSRTTATLITGATAFLLGVPSAIGTGTIAGYARTGAEFLGLMDFFASNVLLPVGGLLLALFVGWVWGVKRAARELSLGAPTFKGVSTWAFLVRYAVPAAIAIILVVGLLG